MSQEAAKYEQAGVAAVSQKLYEGVTAYHAQIGDSVPQGELKRLEDKLLKEAADACFAEDFDSALHCFMQALALSEKTKTSADPGLRGTLVHNIGFCLHCIGEFEAAKAYYEQSIECLKKAKENEPLSTKVINGLMYPERLVLGMIYGGLNDNRIQSARSPPRRPHARARAAPPRLALTPPRRRRAPQ